MKISEYSEGWHASGVKRRDNRRSSGALYGRKVRLVGKGRRKDTKRWCKGIEGREHSYRVIKAAEEFRWTTWDSDLEACGDCGRQRYAKRVNSKGE